MLRKVFFTSSVKEGSFYLITNQRVSTVCMATINPFFMVTINSFWFPAQMQVQFYTGFMTVLAVYMGQSAVAKPWQCMGKRVCIKFSYKKAQSTHPPT